MKNTQNTKRRNINVSSIPFNSPFIDVSNSYISRFDFLNQHTNVQKINATNTLISNFSNAPICSSLREIEIEGSPISENTNYRLMILIMLCPNIEYIDKQRVTEDERKKSLFLQPCLHPKLYEGFILKSTDPATLTRDDETIIISNDEINEAKKGIDNNIHFNQVIQMMEQLSLEISNTSNEIGADFIRKVPVSKLLQSKTIEINDYIFSKSDSALFNSQKNDQNTSIKSYKKYPEKPEDLVGNTLGMRNLQKIKKQKERKKTQSLTKDQLKQQKESVKYEKVEMKKEFLNILDKKLPNKENVTVKNIFENASRIISSPWRSFHYAKESDSDSSDLSASLIKKRSGIPINIDSPSKKYGNGLSSRQLTQTKFGGYRKISDTESISSYYEEEEEEIRNIAIKGGEKAETESFTTKNEEETETESFTPKEEEETETEIKSFTTKNEEETETESFTTKNEEETKTESFTPKEEEETETEIKSFTTKNEEETEKESFPPPIPSEENQQMIICAACKKPIDKNECIIHSGHQYHQNCIKCIVCQRIFELDDDLEDFICTTPGQFICVDDYQKHLDGEELIPEAIKSYHQQNKKTFVEELFNPPIFKKEEVIDRPPEDIFIGPDVSNEVVRKNDLYEDFIPTITFKFDSQPNDFNYEGFIKILNETFGEDAVIVNVERGSTIIKIAFASIMEAGEDIHSKYKNIVNSFSGKLKNSTMGESIVGNLVEEPIIKIPENDQKIIEEYNKPSINLLQNTEELNEVELKEIKNDVIKILQEKKKQLKNWNFIFSHEDLFEQAEMQVREDIRNNPFEMIVVGQTLIANKFLNEYEKIKRQISPEDVCECFFYHGSCLKNHEKIVKNHFLNPERDQMEQLDEGYYGKGIYATDNLFYACLYSNGYQELLCNKKTHVICCRAIYNKSHVKDVIDNKYYGKPIDQEIKDHYGINHAFVGSSKDYNPVYEKSKDNNYIYGNEYVFSNEFQLVPVYSFTIMRKDHYILWKDENLDGSENQLYLKELSKRIEVNIYEKKTVEEALEVIRTKKHSRFKLITNGGQDLTGKRLIEKAREIIKSNFVCLVFAKSEKHMEWISQMENVLFTTDSEDFKEFSEIKLNRKNILEFARELERKHHYKFKINEAELVKFHVIDNFKRSQLFNQIIKKKI